MELSNRDQAFRIASIGTQLVPSFRMAATSMLEDTHRSVFTLSENIHVRSVCNRLRLAWIPVIYAVQRQHLAYIQCTFTVSLVYPPTGTLHTSSVHSLYLLYIHLQVPCIHLVYIHCISCISPYRYLAYIQCTFTVSLVYPPTGTLHTSSVHSLYLLYIHLQVPCIHLVYIHCISCISNYLADTICKLIKRYVFIQHSIQSVGPLKALYTSPPRQTNSFQHQLDFSGKHSPNLQLLHETIHSYFHCCLLIYTDE